jgi:hypothetical protein
MRPFVSVLALTILVTVPAFTQTTDLGTQAAKPDQAAKSAEPQGHSTLIGCLSGPDVSGKYVLRSMEHRTGVEVMGSDDLKKGSGAKVKLTGLWKPGEKPAAKGKESRMFQASEVEVMSDNCQTPSEKIPVSKQRQQQQQQKQKASPPPAADTTSPK